MALNPSNSSNLEHLALKGLNSTDGGETLWAWASIPDVGLPVEDRFVPFPKSDAHLS